MKARRLLYVILSIAVLCCCDGILGNLGQTDDTEYVSIGSVAKDGIYKLKGTVVAVGNEAYVLADQTGAILVYGYDHGRSMYEVVAAEGEVYRYRGFDTNVFQMKTSSVEVVSAGASWNYAPTTLDAAAFDAMVGKTAVCRDVAFEGMLTRDNEYIIVRPDGASRTSSFKYVSTSEYNNLDGEVVEVSAFVVGTHNYLYILPYRVEIKGGISEPPVDVEPDKGEAERGWMELPAMNTTGLDYYYHSFTKDSKTYRNYSFGWDDSNKVAIWVAYPLCSFYTTSYDGENHRHEEYFIKDPLLGDASPRPGGGWAGEYDRGHQIPSADRQCSELANGQTYYGTNMTAQSNPLNGGPWANLEGAVRDFAKSSSDTTYVVTGCYVEDTGDWSTDSDGMRIKVPTAYFKAILVLKNGNWTGGGAYWTPHVGYASSYASWATSIDWLEQKTGLNLFANLPDKIGASAAAKIEAATSGEAKWWK